MFNFEEIHLKALLKLLNFVNQEYLVTKTCVQRTKSTAKGKMKTKALPKPSNAHQLTIESIDIHNRQLVIDSILNCCLYFDQFFKYNYKCIIYKTDDKVTKLYKWLQNYYKKDFLDSNVDFKIVVKEVPEIVDNSRTDDTNCANVGADEAIDKEMNESDMVLALDPQQMTSTRIEQSEEEVQEINELTAKIVHNIRLILLLVLIIFFKVKKLFPKLLDYFEFAWIYLSEFESRVESELLIESLIEILQNEFVSQRNANRMRSEVLSNEVIQLNAMIENLEKQLEDETKELIYLQNATIIGGNASANARQLSKIMNVRTGQQKEGKIFPCPECGKQFKNGYKLNRHRYVHKDPSEKPYVCDWPGCGYRSIANNDLNRHRMIHTGEKPFQDSDEQ